MRRVRVAEGVGRQAERACVWARRRMCSAGSGTTR